MLVASLHVHGIRLIHVISPGSRVEYQAWLIMKPGQSANVSRDAEQCIAVLQTRLSTSA